MNDPWGATINNCTAWSDRQMHNFCAMSLQKNKGSTSYTYPLIIPVPSPAILAINLLDLQFSKLAMTF